MTAPAFDIPGYSLVRQLGEGGMATVYLAVQRSLDRKVAIKVMRRGLADPKTEARFLNEGRTMARLPHPHIVGVFDIVQNETINYIAMEYLEGGLLSDRMRHGLSLAEAIAIIVQIASALQYAHDNGVVHRDLKPANVMFRDDHTAVITDFGIARAQGPGAARLTQTGMMLGTPTYMSPEQATAGEVDGRSDQYSLGVLFYEMLTGHPPFEGESPIQVALAHVSQPPPPLPPQFSFFQPIMDRMLAKLPDHRYPDLSTFIRELKALLTGNKALMQRLQLDPRQSSSEQLRALGFSESQISTGARRAPTPPPSRAVTQEERSPVYDTGPGVRMDPMPPPARERPKWLLPGGIAAGVLVLVLGLWGIFGGKTDKEIDPVLKSLLDDRLVVIDRLIEDNKLVAPAGESAYDKLQEVLQLAPGYDAAQQRLDGIVGKLRQQAEAALAAKNFEVAEVRISEALAVAPKDAGLLAVQKSIAGAQVAAEREARVAGLLTQAQAARRAGKLIGADRDNALALLRQAQEIDPESERARTAVAEVIKDILQPADAALQAGRLDEAEDALAAAATALAGDQAWQALSKALEAKRTLMAQQARIDSLLQLARRQFQAGNLAEPAGDNALETLSRVFELDSGNAAAVGLRGEIAAGLARLAEQAERAGDFTAAFARYDQALRADPGNAAFTGARKALEQRLGERQTQLARAIADARAAIAERRYFAPAGRNARELLAAALAIDAGNATARQLQSELPNLVRGSAEAMAREGSYDEALALLAEAAKAYPTDRNLTQVSARLSTERDRARAVAAREEQLAALRTRLARGPLDAAGAGEVGSGLAALLKNDPRDADALAIRSQFVAGVGRSVAAADATRQLDALVPVLEQVQQQLGASSADVTALLADFRTRRESVAAREEQDRLARQGVLVLNAFPWANVESVVDQASGASISLPTDRATPLRLPLQAGTYRITFRHPDAAQPVVRVAGLEAQKTQQVSAAFPTLKADDYLRRAGYAR